VNSVGAIVRSQNLPWSNTLLCLIPTCKHSFIHTCKCMHTNVCVHVCTLRWVIFYSKTCSQIIFHLTVIRGVLLQWEATFYLPAICPYLAVGLVLNETVLALTEMKGWSYIIKKGLFVQHITQRAVQNHIYIYMCVCVYLCACSAIWMYCNLQLINT
jgi:hypothetical protein